jgi:hypothetical protein
MAAYAVLAVAAFFLLQDDWRLGVWILLAALALKTWIGSRSPHQ